MSALNTITKRDRQQPTSAMVTMSHNALHTALATIEAEYRDGKYGPVDQIAASPSEQPTAALTDRLWTLLGGRSGG